MRRKEGKEKPIMANSINWIVRDSHPIVRSHSVKPWYIFLILGTGRKAKVLGQGPSPRNTRWEDYRKKFKKKKKIFFLNHFGHAVHARILAPWSGTNPALTAVQAHSLDHWTARAVPFRKALRAASVSSSYTSASPHQDTSHSTLLINIDNKYAMYCLS